MLRRKRSGTADSDAELVKMSKSEIEAEIQRCLWGFENGGSSQGRKAYFKRLVWLEQKREELFSIAAPRRLLRK
jgi:hypothetical protein